jgi:hypothetical protein
MTKKYGDSLYGKGGRFNNEKVQNFIDAINVLIPDVEPNPLREGEKVKIDVERIKSYPTWDAGNLAYKQFVLDNVDTIFTIEFEEKQKKDKLACVLKEDSSPIKWIFYQADLLRIEEKYQK